MHPQTAPDPADGLDPGQAPDLEELRARIRRLEGGGRAAAPAVLPLGPAALDGRLPGGGLALGGLHEILPGQGEWDEGPASGFALAIAARLLAERPGILLWASPVDDLYAPAAALGGLPPERLLRVRAHRTEELFWALEQGLRCNALAGVVGEVAALEPVAGRRLQLAAESGGRPCLLLQRGGPVGGRPTAGSPAATRWRVAALPSDPALPRQLVGRPRWRLELLRCRGGGRPAAFEVEWDDATGDFALAAPLRDRAAPAVA